MMKDLILGYATNCRFEDFYRFVKSARRCMEPAEVDIAVYMDRLGDRFSELAIGESVTIVPVPNTWKRTRASRLLNLELHLWIEWLKLLARVSPGRDRPHLQEVYFHAVAEWIHPQAGRWLFLRDFLAVNSAYRLAMISDVRDVVFQSSPFAGLDERALHVFEQDGTTYEPGKNLDSEWIEKVYGREELLRLRGRTSACSGTVLGTPATLLGLLDRMAPDILRRRRTPLDQAIFNKVVISGYEGPVARHPIAEGPVLTVCTEADPWRIVEGRVQVGDRVVPAVHMYDRRPALRALVESLYPIPGDAQPVSGR